jgi:3-hydroxyisobutyrate dehydrogenase
MGNPMARNLAKKGFSVTVFDKMESACLSLAKDPQILQGNGSSVVTIAKSIPEVAQKSDLIITMLPATTHVEQTYLGSLLKDVEKGERGKIFLDSSTIDPAMSKLIHAKFREKGSFFLDAPVSGGVLGADAGTLTFMVGNDSKDSLNPSILPILQAMGKNIVHCGEIGHGLVAKLCNNMVSE